MHCEEMVERIEKTEKKIRKSKKGDLRVEVREARSSRLVGGRLSSDG